MLAEADHLVVLELRDQLLGRLLNFDKFLQQFTPRVLDPVNVSLDIGRSRVILRRHHVRKLLSLLGSFALLCIALIAIFFIFSVCSKKAGQLPFVALRFHVGKFG